MPNASVRLASALILLFGAGAQAVAGSGAQRPNRSGSVQAAAVVPTASSIPSMSVTPGTLTFNATDPDLGLVAANASVTVNFTMSGGSSNRDWTLAVASSSSTFSSCPTLDNSAVTVTCSSAMTDPGGGGSAACSGPIQLSTTPQTVASGKEDKRNDHTFAVTLIVALRDEWRHRAATSPPCTLSLSYRLSVP